MQNKMLSNNVSFKHLVSIRKIILTDGKLFFQFIFKALTINSEPLCSYCLLNQIT